MLRKIPVFLLLSLATLATAAHAQTVYSWKDANGRTHYSDTPPPEGNTRTLRQPSIQPSSGASASSSGNAASYQEQDQAFRKRRAEAAEAETKARKEQLTSAARQKECQEAQRQLTAIENGQRMARYDDAGERVFLTDEERNSNADNLRKFISSSCNN